MLGKLNRHHRALKRVLLVDYIFIVQAASNTKNLDVGANVFIGNLDPEIDEKLLYDIFSAFGVILQTPKVCKCEFNFPSCMVCCAEPC